LTVKSKINELIKNKLQLTLAIVVVLVIVTVGSILLFGSHAEGPYTSAIPSAGSLTGSAGINNDTTALNDKSVSFNSSTTTTPPVGAEGGCTYNGVVAPCVGGTSGTGASGWGTPIFNDTFTSDSDKLNTKTWTPDWFNNGNTGSNETTSLSSLVTFNSDGYLDLGTSGGSASNINAGGDHAGAGGNMGLISSDPNDNVSGHSGFQYTYGFAEARIYLPGTGTKVDNWPAFWSVGQNWPTDGEIDTLEGLVGSACYHFIYPATSNGTAQGACPTNANYTGWGTFASDWQNGIITYYYDGVDVGTITQGITSSPMFIVAENSTGYLSGPFASPDDMLVSYIRVWQN
jgi:hypothetical protein